MLHKSLLCSIVQRIMARRQSIRVQNYRRHCRPKYILASFLRYRTTHQLQLHKVVPWKFFFGSQFMLLPVFPQGCHVTVIASQRATEFKWPQILSSFLSSSLYVFSSFLDQVVSTQKENISFHSFLPILPNNLSFFLIQCLSGERLENHSCIHPTVM